MFFYKKVENKYTLEKHIKKRIKKINFALKS